MLEILVSSLLIGPNGQAWPFRALNVFLLSMTMLCLASECELNIRVCSFLARPHGQAWAELELRFWFVSMRMQCLASEYELEFWVWSLFLSPQALARAGLVLKFFWMESWIFEFFFKRSTLLGGFSVLRPLQGPWWSNSRSRFFWCIFHPWGLINPHLGAATCLNFQSEACLEGHMVKPDHVLCWMFLSWVWGCYVLHQSMSSIFESVACLQGHMVRPEQSLSWNFDLLVWGCGALHQSVSSSLESEACFQAHKLLLELGLFWIFFEWRVEFLSFAPNGSHCLRGVSAPRPLQGPLRSSGRSHSFWCIFHPWGLINPHLGAATCLNFQPEACLQGHMVKPDHDQCWMFFFLNMRMLCLASEYELNIRVCSLLVRPHGQAWAELELRFWFVSMRMQCLASECELKFWVWSLLSSPQALARAQLVLNWFWMEGWIFEFCTKRSTLLGGVSAPGPLQRSLRSSGRSLFF
jgi:hypothetical protein